MSSLAEVQTRESSEFSARVSEAVSAATENASAPWPWINAFEVALKEQAPQAVLREVSERALREIRPAQRTVYLQHAQRRLADTKAHGLAVELVDAHDDVVLNPANWYYYVSSAMQLDPEPRRLQTLGSAALRSGLSAPSVEALAAAAALAPMQLGVEPTPNGNALLCDFVRRHAEDRHILRDSLLARRFIERALAHYEETPAFFDTFRVFNDASDFLMDQLLREREVFYVHPNFDGLAAWMLAQFDGTSELSLNDRLLALYFAKGDDARAEQLFTLDDFTEPHPRWVFLFKIMWWNRGDFFSRVIDRSRIKDLASDFLFQLASHEKISGAPARDALVLFEHFTEERAKVASAMAEIEAARTPAAPSLAAGRKKVAVCLSGQLRGYETAGPRLMSVLRNTNAEVETFVHTWEQVGGKLPTATRVAHRCFTGDFLDAWRQMLSDQQNPAETLWTTYPALLNGLEKNNVASPELLTEIYAPREIVIERETDLPQLETNQHKMLYKIEACFDLAIRSGDFSHVVRTRPDKVWDPKQSLDTMLDMDLSEKVLSDGGAGFFGWGGYAGMGDQVAFGTTRNMGVYSSAYSLQRRLKTAGVRGLERDMGHFAILYALGWNEIGIGKLPLFFSHLAEAKMMRPEQIRALLGDDAAARGPHRYDEMFFTALDQDIAAARAQAA